MEKNWHADDAGWIDARKEAERRRRIIAKRKQKKQKKSHRIIRGARRW